MIEFDSRIPRNFLVLDPQETMQGYYAAYGDEIARHYESNGVILIPHFPLQFDLKLFQALTMPPEAKKIGTATGIEKPVIIRSKNDPNFAADQDHVLVKMTGDPNFAIYLQSQIATANCQIRVALKTLFPRYTSMIEGNISWRMVPTGDEGMHLDEYAKGKPFRESQRQKHRIKLFINIDSEPRRWRTSFDIAGVLTYAAKRLPPEMPANLNVVNSIINRCGALEGVPAHSISYPTLSAVLANGETVAHQVVYGRRMIAAEFTCDYQDMLDREKHPFSRLSDWLASAGIKAADNPEDPRLPSDWLREAGIKERTGTYH